MVREDREMDSRSVTVDSFKHVRNPALRHVISYWFDTCSGRSMPARRDISPIEPKRTARFLMSGFKGKPDALSDPSIGRLLAEAVGKVFLDL